MTITILILVLILFGSLYYYLFIYKLSKKEKEIIKGCIKHYEVVIQVVEVSDNWRYVMSVNLVSLGLCHYLSKKVYLKYLKNGLKEFHVYMAHFGTYHLLFVLKDITL